MKNRGTNQILKEEAECYRKLVEKRTATANPKSKAAAERLVKTKQKHETWTKLAAQGANDAIKKHKRLQLNRMDLTAEEAMGGGARARADMVRPYGTARGTLERSSHLRRVFIVLGALFIQQDRQGW